jgi:hypothetical protein
VLLIAISDLNKFVIKFNLNTMKKIILALALISFKIFGQSVELKPGSNGFIMIPNVNSLAACGISDKGKIVYYSLDNTLRMCNGIIWQNIVSGSFTVPYSFTGSNNNNLMYLENTNTSAFSSTIYSVTNTDEYVGAVTGISRQTNPTLQPSGIRGFNSSLNSNGYGVYGEHSGFGNGVFGISRDGFGVKGESANNYGVQGRGGNIGVWGQSTSSQGVQGSSTTGIGVFGISTSGIGGSFSSGSGYALITGTGNVGIGTSNPAAQLDIKGFTHTSHFYFGANQDTYIRGGVNASNVLINDVAGLGSVGIGLSNPNELLDVNGRMRIRHKINTAGLWMSNSTNSLNGADGAFYGMKTDTETGIFIGNAWRFWVNSAGSGFLNGNLIQTSDKRLKKEISLLNNSL